MSSRYVKRTAVLALVALTSLGFVTPARANHETIVIDGDLSDLIGAIGRNAGGDKGGFSAASSAGDICVPGFCCFTNGFDAKNFYLFIDFKNPDGSLANNITLYAGWETFGVIGDVDGDGNPDTFNPAGPGAGCALGDDTGIGSGELYTIDVDLGCNGVSDLTLGVTNNGAFSIPSGAVGQFKASGKFLELRIDNLQNLVPAGMDLCDASFRMTTNAKEDGLGEDRSGAFVLGIPPSVTIAKTPVNQMSGPNQLVEWTIPVTNNGLCNLQTVTVSDVLDPGLSFESSVPPPTVPDPQHPQWTFTNLAKGGSQTITLRARLGATCVANTLADHVTANAVRSRGMCGANATAMADASASVTCESAPGRCRLTGGGCLNEKGDNQGHKENTFGGNVSPLHDGGGPTGNEWEHVRRQGNTILFNFHSHDAHITSCSLVPPGPCSPSAEVTRADFEGTGLYSFGSGMREADANFNATVIDHGEGRCGEPDFYTITVREGLVQGEGAVVFSIEGPSDCGNLQIHGTPARLFGPTHNPVPEPIPNQPTGQPSTGVGDLSDLTLFSRVIPNPFSGTMSFSYRVPQGAGRQVDVGIYDMAGRLVHKLASGSEAPGQYTVQWNGGDDRGSRVAAGMYFLRARVAGVRQVNRVIYLKP